MMSLTQIIRLPDVRQRLRSVYTKPRISSNMSLVAEPQTKAYGLVGTAFDYLLRFEINRRNPSAVSGPWIAENSKARLAFTTITDVSTLDTDIDPSDDLKIIEEILRHARETSASYLLSGEVNDQLLTDSICLAKLDIIYRSGYVDRPLDKANQQDIEDLRTLLSSVPPQLFKAKRHCVLNPSFKDGSTMAAGADADVLIDDTLIEIKTTKSKYINPEHFDQLVGYLALARIWGIDGLKSKPGITKLAIYFSRYGEYCEFPIDDFMHLEEFDEFIAWFRGYLEQRHNERIAKKKRRSANRKRRGSSKGKRKNKPSGQRKKVARKR